MFAVDGCRVAGAATAAAARATALKARFDFMVIDFRLPDQSGIELVQELAAAGIATPAVIVTGYPEAQSALAATRLNVDYVAKADVRPEQLVVLARRRLAGSDHKVHQLLRAAAAAFGPPARQLGREFPQHFAQAAVSRNISLVDFMTTAEALHCLLRPQTAHVPISQQLQFLADQQHSRLTIARNAGLDSTFQRGTENVTNAAVTPPIRVSVPGLGWSSRRMALAIPMRRGAIELANTSEQVAQIGYLLGYEHHAAFDRHFGGFFGCSPSAFRRLLRQTP